MPLEIEDYEDDIETLMKECTKAKDDLVTTFDACLALKPMRTDIIRWQMDMTHSHLLKVLSIYWENNAIEMTPFETLTLIDWSFQYNNQLG